MARVIVKRALQFAQNGEGVFLHPSPLIQNIPAAWLCLPFIRENVIIVDTVTETLEREQKETREKVRIKENNAYISIITPANPVFDTSQVKTLFTRSYNTPDPVKFTTLENRERLKIEETDFLEWTNVVNYVKEQVTCAPAQARA